MLPYLHPQAGGTAIDADLVLLQRLPAEQAQLAAEIWQLAVPMTHQLSELTDDGVVALGPNLWLPLRLVTTPRRTRNPRPRPPRRLIRPSRCVAPSCPVCRGWVPGVSRLGA